MSDRVRQTGRSVLHKLAGPAQLLHRVAVLEEANAAAQERISQLEADLQETRRINRRIAELTDVVQELLLPVAQRDEAAVNEFVDKYAAGLR